MFPFFFLKRFENGEFWSQGICLLVLILKIKHLNYRKTCQEISNLKVFLIYCIGISMFFIFTTEFTEKHRKFFLVCFGV